MNDVDVAQGVGTRSVVREAGDAALLLELDPVIDPAVNARAIGTADALRAQCLAGVRDVVPTFRSVAVHFDPATADVAGLVHALRTTSAETDRSRGSLIEIPVVYGGEAGPDLSEVAAFARRSEAEVIDRHTAEEYRVFMLGFLPGFAYMGMVDRAIAMPRRPTPRTHVPAGSVGIAGRQTGVYPVTSPGGWQLIGRTALRIFDSSRTSPSLFSPGDRVRFVPQADGSAPPFGPVSVAGDRGGGESPSDIVRGAVTVLRPGLFTTVQDLGRWGYQHLGVPVAGPMDAVSHRLANVLVGNATDAATLEATMTGPELRFEHPTVVAVTGADLSATLDGRRVSPNAPHTCPAGSVMRFGERRIGARAYLACAGGIATPVVLGSRATHALSRLGGVDGRALRAGDQLSIGTPLDGPPRRPEVSSLPGGGARLRVMTGPQDTAFDEAAFDALRRTRFTVSPQSNRMGYRLVGAPIGRPPGDAISDAAFVGGVQVPPSGEPILLMADRQTTGGYPQIATVITADLALAGQLAPGDWVEFEVCTQREAAAALLAQEKWFDAIQ